MKTCTCSMSTKTLGDGCEVCNPELAKDLLIERLRLLEIDHEPEGWPAIKMQDVSLCLDLIESQAAEIAELKALCDQMGAALEWHYEQYADPDSEKALTAWRASK